MLFVSSRSHLLQAHIRNGQFAAVCHHHHNLLPGQEPRLSAPPVCQDHIKEQGTTWGGWRAPTSSPITNPESFCSPVRWMLNQKCWLATESHASDWGAWLSQLEPLGQFLSLKHMDKPSHTCCTLWEAKTLINVKRLTKYQRSQRSGDLGPPSTSAHCRAWKSSMRTHCR